MISLLQLEFIVLVACFLLFLIVYIKQKKFAHTKDLIWDSIIDAVTLNSGIILLMFLIGKVFKIPYLSAIDDFALYIGLLIAGLVIIGGSVDKLRGNKNDKKKKRKGKGQ
jgi:membrane protease YdiL (CAAX protease family)